MVQLATKPQYIAYASVQQFDINTLHRRFGYVGKDAPQKAYYLATTKRQISRTTPTAKETAEALRTFEKAAQQLTANSLLAGRESMILMIAEGDKDYNNQEDVDPDDNGVYRIDALGCGDRLLTKGASCQNKYSWLKEGLLHGSRTLFFCTYAAGSGASSRNSTKIKIL